jgi:hypothetical protein
VASLKDKVWRSSGNQEGKGAHMVYSSSLSLCLLKWKEKERNKIEGTKYDKYQERLEHDQIGGTGINNHAKQ